MFALATFFLTALASTVAQAPPPQAPPPESAVAAPMAQPLETGPCLDSIRSVPKVLKAPLSRGMQVVRIDQVVSTATMMPGEIIGFLYTTHDGSTWLGQRTPDYQSAADATAVNRVLAATHVAGYNVTGFPPTNLYGVPTKHPQLFRVQVPPNSYGPLRITLIPCVIWPATRSLPDPTL